MRELATHDSAMQQDPDEWRAALAAARVYLIFTPSLCGARDPLLVLREVLPWIDLIQVRPKARESGLDPLISMPASRRLNSANSASSASSAGETYDWSR